MSPATPPDDDRHANMTRQDYANALRALSMDAVQHARSGHPDTPPA